MQAQRTPTVTATAELELRVPRDGERLERDAETVLERVDGVVRADVEGLTGVTPTLNDLQVGVAVRLRFDPDDSTGTDAAGLRETLADGFGVDEVSTVEVETA
ncbi:hypothetical protein [Halostella sp. PRR32]|uniref:hypothetical protein n=1 Tax=Halostella sp. PRR32 TaxID=3098147 RepID=UPI002B1D1F51|nr:hypothetical protein [Halostella sp. PRR32]